MPKRYTYEYVKQYFEDNGCELLEDNYIHSKIKMKYICKCGNESGIRFCEFVSGQRCMECSGTGKHTYEFVKKTFKEKGCVLLVEEKDYKCGIQSLKYICKCGTERNVHFNQFKNREGCRICSGKEKHSQEYIANIYKENNFIQLEKYTDSYTLMKCICRCGNETAIRISDLKNGVGCAKCGGNEKLTYEYVKNFFEKEGCILLESKYINTNTKMKYICNCGKESSVFFNDFKDGTRCMTCGGYEKFTYEYVKKCFEEINYTLLEEMYVNCLTPMRYICNQGHERKIRFDQFNNGIRCAKCSGVEKYTYEYVKDFFEKEKCKLLEDHYDNANTRMKYICVCGKESKINFSRFRQGDRCYNCRRRSKGEEVIKNYFTKNNILYESQIGFSSCRYQNKLKFDFSIEKNSKLILIEYQGIQHYLPVCFSDHKDVELTNFHFIKNIKKDKIKKDWCVQNNIELLEIPFWDFKRIEILLDEFFQGKELSFSQPPRKVIKYQAIKEKIINSFTPKLCQVNPPIQ